MIYGLNFNGTERHSTTDPKAWVAADKALQRLEKIDKEVTR